MRYIIALFLSVATLNAASFIEPDAEVKVLGLVCPSCAIGLKKSFKRHRSVKEVKLDTKKGLMFLDFEETKDGKVAWITNPQIIKMVKKSGYDVSSIKRLHNEKPNRYNKP
jgi:copper chaperone CopZ|tara:strand:+ start:108 stop:440 length:333 start_codon:yes stop_codon:yes gene_type:complete